MSELDSSRATIYPSGMRDSVFVTSRTREGVFYRVIGYQHGRAIVRCTCERGRRARAGTCFHARAASLFGREVEEQGWPLDVVADGMEIVRLSDYEERGTPDPFELIGRAR